MAVTDATRVRESHHVLGLFVPIKGSDWYRAVGIVYLSTAVRDNQGTYLLWTQRLPSLVLY